MLTVAAFYHFTRLPDPAALRKPLVALAREAGVKGSILLAGEGVNGTIAGTPGGVARMLAALRALPGCAGMEHKESQAAAPPFVRMKVKLKAEIVTMGQPGVDPARGTGHYVDAADWNDLISAQDIAVIDTRNRYETAIGSFRGAEIPAIDTFRDFPSWWQANKSRFDNKRIAMFCTGGIRCEKSTNWLLGQGVPEVFHLRGGILKYLEDVPEDQSLWNGQCYVFDQRVSVGHGLQPGDYTTCHACRRPLSPADKTHPAYEEGVSCPACETEYSTADRDRFRERMLQMRLADARGTLHIGPPKT